MHTRFEGVLSQWDDARGFGFITPSAGGEALFAHVSAFPRMAQRPAIGLRLSFEVETRPDGKKRARQIRLLSTTEATENSIRASHTQPRHHNRRRRTPVLLVLLGMMLATWAYQHYAPKASASSGNGFAPARQNEPLAPELDMSGPKTPEAAWRCDERTHCSQMSSCAEAKFFLNHCPNTEMDGDHDGIPCEQQWCTGPLGN